MKTPLDPRHRKRQKTVQFLFSWSFRKIKSKDKLVKLIFDNLEKIDKVIGECALEWPVEKIAKIDLAILRLAVGELAIVRKEPRKVIIDEAVELAKEFGGETSSSFINGVLGTVVKKLDKKP